MSQSVPPQMEGQVDTPNPVELFWEQHQKAIMAVAMVVLLGVAALYAKRHYDAVQRNLVASRFAEVTGLSLILTQKTQGRWSMFIDLDAHLAKVDRADLESYIAKEAPVECRPWAIWVSAKCHLLHAEPDQAESRLTKLKESFPDHILCALQVYPPQTRDPVEEEGNGKKDKDKPKNPRDEKPVLLPPVSGSPVDQLLASIRDNRKFQKEHPGLFVPVEPKGKVVELLLNNTKVVVQLYEQAAPKHVEHFLKLVREGFYDRQKVYKIQRDPVDAKQPREPQLIHLGLAKTKETGDTAEWDKAAAEASQTILDFPTTEAAKKLSFFPGMLAAENEKDGKVSGERVFLAANDCAGSMDGSFVILGKVISDITELQKLVTEEINFTSGDEAKVGVGKPSEPIEISIGVRGEAKQPPRKQEEQATQPIKKEKGR